MTQSEANMLARAIVREWNRANGITNEVLLTADELASLLKVSVSYVRQHTNDFPHVKIGNSVRFPKSRVLQSILI